MSTYWNFRKILDVHPEQDDRCVAFNKGTETRCGINGKAGRANLESAGVLLDTMDRTLSLSECREHLDKLAHDTMCGNPHRKMDEVREHRVRLWNESISEYIAEVQNQKEKPCGLKSENDLDKDTLRETIAAESETVQTTPSTATENQQPQMEAQDPVILLTSETGELRTKTADLFINNNETTPKFQPRRGDLTIESTDTDIIPTISDHGIFKISSLDSPEEIGDPIGAHSATQRYGLPSPPDSTLVTHIPKRQTHAYIQSPPETPTKVSASISKEQADLTRSEASSEPLKNIADGTDPLVKFGPGRCTSPLQLFNSNFVTPTTGIQSSSTSNYKPDPCRLPNFEVEIESKENSARVFKFGLPSEATAKFGDLPPSNRPDFHKGPNESYKTTEPQTIEMIPKPASNSSISESPKNTAPNNTIDEDQHNVVTTSPVLASNLHLPAIIDEDPKTSLPFEFQDASKPLGTQIPPDQAEITVLESSYSPPVHPVRSVEILKGAPNLTFETASHSKPKDPLPSPGEKPIPIFTVESNSNSPPTKPGLNYLSSERKVLLPVLVDDRSTFQFGSNDKIPPNSFDFDTWSELSFAARIPHKFSTMWSHILSDLESKSGTKDGGEKGEETKTEVLLRTEMVNDLALENVAKGQAIPSRDNFVTDDYVPESMPEPLKTPQKPYASQSERLMTPEATPNQPQCKKTVLVLPEETATDSDAPEQPESAINKDYQPADEATMALEAMDVPLRKDVKVTPMAIVGNDSKAPRTPGKAHESLVQDLVSKSTPEISQVPAISTPIVVEVCTSSAESTLKSTLQMNYENNDNLTIIATSETSQMYEINDNLFVEMSKISAKPSSELAMVNQDLFPAREENTATPEATFALPNLNEDSITIVEGGNANLDAELGPLNMDQDALEPDGEDHGTSTIRHERSGPDEKVLSVMEENITTCQITPEPICESVTKSVESFGHVFIGPAERRYTTRFSESRRHDLLTTQQILEVSNNRGHKDTTSSLNFETFSNSSPGFQPPAEDMPIPQKSEEPGAPSGRRRDDLAGEQLHWENDRGIPKKHKAFILGKDVLRQIHHGCSTVYEVVRTKPGRTSEGRQD